MQDKNSKIQLYAVRDFGQQLTVVMDFLRQNWKPVLIYLTYFLLPLSLVQALSLNSFMGGYFNLLGGMMNNSSDASVAGIVSLLLGLLAFMALYIIEAIFMYAVVYGLMRLYQRGDGPLRTVTWQELKPDFMFSLKRSVIMMVVSIVVGFVLMTILGLVMMGLALVHEALILLSYLFLIAFVVCLVPPLSLIMPVYVFEDQISLFDAIKKGCRLGFRCWLVAVGVVMILGLIVNIVSQFTSLPWSIMFLIKVFFGLGIDGLDGSFTENVFYSFGTYLSGVLQCYGGYLTSAILVIGTAFLYGYAAEKLDGMSVDNNIRNFENL